MRKSRIIYLLLCIGFLLSMISPVAFAAAEESLDKSITAGSHSLDAQLPVLGTKQLIKNAEAVMLVEATSETLMYAWNADVQLYPASFVKIMTALIAIEQGNLTDIVTVTGEVLATVPENAVSADLKENEILTLEQLLYLMLVSSANDAAAVIADHIAGSQADFVTQMNQYAQELGCTGTLFTDAHGLDGSQYMTARDTARILVKAVQNEQFCTIFGTVNYSVEATNKSDARHLSTGNFLMNREDVEIYYDSRVTGGRTGVTNSGDRCIAALAEKDNLKLISVVMGAKSEYEDDGNHIRSFGGFPETSQLLDLGFDDYQVFQVFYSGQALKQQTVANGDCDVLLSPKVSASTVLPVGTTTEGLSFRYTSMEGLHAPIEKGQLISRVEVYHEELCVAQADLYAMNQVSVQQVQTADTQQTASGGEEISAVLWILAVIAGTVLILMLGMRLAARVRKAAANNRSRRYRRDRRRSR